MKNYIIKENNFNSEKMSFENFTETGDKKFVISKIWYRENPKVRPTSLFIQTANLRVHEANENCLSLIITNFETYNAIDTAVLKKIKQDSIVRKYGLKSPSYKSTVGESTNDKNLNVLRFNKISNTKFFVDDHKTAKSYCDVKELINSETTLKIIFEIDKVIVDIAKNYIFTYMTLSQVRIKIVPQKIELSEYSFLDDDSDKLDDSSDELNNSEDLNNLNKLTNQCKTIDKTILNTQTEYMDDLNDNNSNNKFENQQSDSDESNMSTDSSDSIDSNNLNNSSESDCSDQSNQSNNSNNSGDESDSSNGNFKMTNEFLEGSDTDSESNQKSKVNDFLQEFTKTGKKTENKNTKKIALIKSK